MHLYTRAQIEEAIEDGETAYVSSESEIILDYPIQVNQSSTIVGGRFYAPSGEPAFVVTASGVNLERTQIRGQGKSFGYTHTQKLIHAVGTPANPLYDISIHNATLTDSAADNIWLQWVKQSKVATSTIKDYLYSGVMLISCDGVDVSGNHISGAPLSTGVVNTYGIAATDLSNSIEGRSKNITISGNILEDIEWEAIDTHGGTHICISHNIINNCVRGVALVVGNSSRVTVPNNCTVTGNIIDGMGSTREGICLYGLPGNLADATVTGNSIRGHKTPIYANQYDRALTRIGANSVPHVGWTNLTLTNGWRANPTYLPQYMVDGEMVYLRGMVIPPVDAFHPTFGALASAYAPSILTFSRYTKGSNPGAGDATIGVATTGSLSMYYSTIRDTVYSYPIEGQYRMI